MDDLDLDSLDAVDLLSVAEDDLRADADQRTSSTRWPTCAPSATSSTRCWSAVNRPGRETARRGVTPAGGLVLAFEGQGARRLPPTHLPEIAELVEGIEPSDEPLAIDGLPPSTVAAGDHRPPGLCSRGRSSSVRTTAWGGRTEPGRAVGDGRRRRAAARRRPGDRPAARRPARRAGRRPGMDDGDAHPPPDRAGVRPPSPSSAAGWCAGTARATSWSWSPPRRSTTSSPPSAPTRRPRGSCRCRTRTTPR